MLRPPDGWGDLRELTASAREASDQLRREGTAVRFLRSIFVPEDETCFYLYEAASVDVVREAARRAHLAFDGVSEAVTESTGEGR